MKNKFTKAIDRAFRVLGTKDSEILMLGKCFRDHDGGCDYLYDLCEAQEVASEFDDEDKCCPIASAFIDDYEYEEAEKTFDKLVQMIERSYPEKLKPDYTGTNECWQRYYFITRDYKLKRCCTMTHKLDEGGYHDGQILDFSTIPEDAADKAEETAAIGQIKELVGGIERVIGRVRSIAGKETIADLLSGLLAQIK